MNPNSSPSNHQKDRNMLLLAGIVMTLAIASTFFGLAVRQEKMIQSQIEIAARSYFETIVVTRRWNAEYGGVYVAKKRGMPSNPYLENPDITTTDGQIFTLKNPALMTRELSELAKQTSSYQYHITSLKLINPNNAPDDWERQSLQNFESGTVETSLVAELNGKKMFRLMRPLYFEKSCVGCHHGQEYQEGDVRGGISVALPYDQTGAALKTNREQILSLTALIIGCFLSLFYLVPWRLLGRLSATNTLLVAEKDKFTQLSADLEREVEKRSEELLAANEKLLKDSTERQKANQILQQQIDFEQTLLEAIPVPVFYKDAAGVYLGCNSIFAQFLGRSKEEIIGKTVFELAPQELAEQYHAQDESLFQQTGIQVYAGKVKNQRGAIRDVIFHKARFTHPDGKVAGLIGAIIDTTQQTQAEEELLRYRLQLEEIVSERTKGLEKSQTALQYLLEDVNEAKKELETKVAEIERMNKIFINRELRMMELKETVKRLEQKVNERGGAP